MLDIVMQYRDLLDNLGTLIRNSPYKRTYLYTELNLSRATFYHKLRNKSFTVSEMLHLGYLLFPEEAKAIEIRSALQRSRKESVEGKVYHHEEVMKALRERIGP